MRAGAYVPDRDHRHVRRSWISRRDQLQFVGGCFALIQQALGRLMSIDYSSRKTER
jgi:hypothetical protein